jgi:hypothetical protein
MAKMSFVAAEAGEWPSCPHCKREIREIKYRRPRLSVSGTASAVTVFWCPHCKAVLSASTL